MLKRPIEQRQYAGIFPALKIQQDGLLVRKKLSQEHLEMSEIRPCIPKTLQDKLIMETHRQAGHVRLHKTFHLILQRYWMPCPSRAVAIAIVKCAACQKKMQSVGTKLKSQKRVLYSTRCAEPMEIIYLDFFGKLSPPSNNYNYILSVRDSFSRFVWFIPCPNMHAITVVEALNNHIFSYFGMPIIIKSDNSSSFTNALLHEVCGKLKIDLGTIPFYNYWSNITERAHLDLGRLQTDNGKQIKVYMVIME